MNGILGITSQVREFDYSTDPQVHLQFLQNWTGLNLSQAKNAPTTYKDYKSKSKNWMHGRRAPNYAKTLFPEMINAAESVCDMAVLVCSLCPMFVCLLFGLFVCCFCFVLVLFCRTHVIHII